MFTVSNKIKVIQHIMIHILVADLLGIHLFAVNHDIIRNVPSCHISRHFFRRDLRVCISGHCRNIDLDKRQQDHAYRDDEPYRILVLFKDLSACEGSDNDYADRNQRYTDNITQHKFSPPRIVFLILRSVLRKVVLK